MELYNTDCFEILVDFVNSDRKVDISFTSPPYNRKRNDKYENYDDAIEDYFKFLCDFTDHLLVITKEYVIINIQTNFYNKTDVYKFIGKYSDKIQQIIVWEKSNPLCASGFNITNAYEIFIVLGDKPLKSNNTYTKNHITTSVNEFHTDIHKAVMKKEVCEWFIINFTKENQIIFDPFMGLGTTGLVCKENKRNFIGVEINKEYFDIAEKRIKNSHKKLFC